ncbi:MAG: hypothetical protein NC307_15555 [Roseburia sp.]|nr:hypothetical protein [Roseburia sp.]
MEKKDAVFRSEEELSEVKGNAWSIGAYNIPENPVKYLGSLRAERDIYHYYRDKNGKYFYESERTLKFDREMREAQERHRSKKHRAYTA